jgi:hypothetical protein
MRSGTWATGVGIALMLVLAACGPTAPAQPTSAPAAGIEAPTPAVDSVDAHFNPTEAIGQGANSSSTVTDAARVFAAVQQATQLRITANSSPPGATGADVQSVSVVAQDSGGLLKGLDAAGKQTLGNALLTAAAAAWPNASISLLVSDPTGAAGTIIGNHPKGGQNSVIAS